MLLMAIVIFRTVFVFKVKQGELSSLIIIISVSFLIVRNRTVIVRNRTVIVRNRTEC